jgi:hypothetical protein
MQASERNGARGMAKEAIQYSIFVIGQLHKGTFISNTPLNGAKPNP